MAAVHPGGAGTSRTAGELRQDPLESHEVSGRGERGEFHFQIHSSSDGTLMSSSVSVEQLWRRSSSAEGATHVLRAGVPLGPVGDVGVMPIHE